MAQLKKLYMGNKIDDLEKLSVIPDVRNKSMKILLNTARKLYLTAEEYRLDGDEELAYISYMKYFSILHSIRKKPDYVQHKQLVRQVLGDTDANRRIMDTLELLCDSLNMRYKERLQGATNVEHLAIGDAAASNGKQIATPPSTLEYGKLGVISCEALFQRMQQKSVLVMDCRSSADYDISHLTYYCAFNVAEELIVPGMSAGRLQLKLSSSAKASWASRSVKESVVLMDWNTKDAQPAPSSAIAILLDILKNWDPDVTYRSPIQILEGGYEYFIMMYPTHCTNPSVQAPQQNNNDIDALDDIEYPSINDITMKEDINAGDFSLRLTENVQRPSIDRASKQAAVRTYEERSKPIAEIMRDQAELLQKAQQNDLLLDKAAKKWQTIFELKRLREEGEVLSSSEQELLYSIMQLESAAEDYKIENIRLRDELNQYKEQEQEATPKDAETTRKIEKKIQERQLLDAQHELERLDRERQLAIARETKRLYKPAKELDEQQAPEIKSPTPPPPEETPRRSSRFRYNDIDIDEVLENEQLPVQPPLQPSYDRATKPSVKPPQLESEAKKRDFSPVVGNNLGRGLTGLKNLGNTCYMNSILQCLSNTPRLTEYCISDQYKNYISRSNNKTNGQVIDEVAALIKELWNGNYKCVASRDLRYVVGQYQKIFGGVDQQDSHEFLTILMDWLHSDLQTLHIKPRLREHISASEKAWMDFTDSKESLILHLFYGQMKSTVKCVACHKESATYECFSNLSLELPPNANVCYLNQCMDMYFSGEHIHGWNCPSCNTKRDAIKKLDISKLPPVLVIHLKRFHADSTGTDFIKKQNYLRFPLENMDMTPYIARAAFRTKTPKTYQLYGVSNHYGTMQGGHYTAFCKSSNYGRWFKFDDQIVTALDASNVVSSAAYILFYTWLPSMQQQMRALLTTQQLN